MGYFWGSDFSVRVLTSLKISLRTNFLIEKFVFEIDGVRFTTQIKSIFIGDVKQVLNICDIKFVWLNKKQLPQNLSNSLSL